MAGGAGSHGVCGARGWRVKLAVQGHSRVLGTKGMNESQIADRLAGLRQLVKPGARPE